MSRNDVDPYFRLGNQKQPYPSSRANDDLHYMDEYLSPNRENSIE